MTVDRRRILQAALGGGFPAHAAASPATTTTTTTPAPTTTREATSDIRLKRDIVDVGHLGNGIGLYRYRYIWSDQVYVGVMAQEVAEIVPDAVVYGDDGYLRVDYARLGLRLITWEEWVAGAGPCRGISSRDNHHDHHYDHA